MNLKSKKTDYKSKDLFKSAKRSIPGGVNSPVRAFKAVGGTPVFFEKAKGAYLFDVAVSYTHLTLPTICSV